MTTDKREFLKLQPGEEPVLLLRTASKTGTAYAGFQWPTQAGCGVEAPDWRPSHECGFGLHGALWGCGESTHLTDRRKNGLLWYVVAAREQDVIDLGGKVKAPRVWIEYVGSQAGATKYLYDRAPAKANAIIGLCLAAEGNGSIFSGGDYSQLTGGCGSKLNAGRRSTLTGGNFSEIIAGSDSTISSGRSCMIVGADESTVIAGDFCSITTGFRSTISTGDYSDVVASHCTTIVAGRCCTIVAGRECVVTAGSGSMLTAGYYSAVTAGSGSVITWKILENGRWRLHTVYVGEDGIEPDIPYVWFDGGVCPRDRV